MQLNADIQACASAEAVLGLVSSRLAVFNEVNAATALLIISRRVGKGKAASGISGDVRFAQLLCAAQSLFGRMAPQELSNTLYACGQLGITPPADWLQRYWHASASKLGEFNPQDFSNTLYACGQLGITPPVDWLRRFWHASASKLGEFVPQHFSNTLYACAQLDAKPPTEWLQSFSDSFEQFLSEANTQNLSNTALALAILGLWELPPRRGLWERLLQSFPRDNRKWNAETQLHAQQLYQAYQAAAVERPGLLPAPDPELLAAARKSWVDGMGDRSSRLHADVSACLTRMGVVHVNEQWCERAVRRIDIVVEGIGAPIALEVDGPSHFLQADTKAEASPCTRRVHHPCSLAALWPKAYDLVTTYPRTHQALSAYVHLLALRVRAAPRAACRPRETRNASLARCSTVPRISRACRGAPRRDPRGCACLRRRPEAARRQRRVRGAGAAQRPCRKR